MHDDRDDLPVGDATHPRTRASLEEALADERAALDDLLATRARAAPEEQDLLDQLIARKRQVLAALGALHRRIVDGDAHVRAEHPALTREDANDD